MSSTTFWQYWICRIFESMWLNTFICQVFKAKGKKTNSHLVTFRLVIILHLILYPSHLSLCMLFCRIFSSLSITVFTSLQEFEWKWSILRHISTISCLFYHFIRSSRKIQMSLWRTDAATYYSRPPITNRDIYSSVIKSLSLIHIFRVCSSFSSSPINNKRLS